MTQTISSIQWTATSQVNNQNISVIKCDSAVDSDWKVVTEGTDINGAGFQAAYAIVDNLANAFTATIIYGIQQYGVAPYTRRTFQLPDPTPTVEIQLTGGTVTLTLCQSDMNVPDEQNQLASSGGIIEVAEYNPWFNRNGSPPVADECLLVHFFERACQYQNNFNGAQGGVSPQDGVDPTLAYVCLVYRNTVLIGHLTFNTIGTMTPDTVGGTDGNFAVGDCLTIIGAHVPDATISNFGATLVMNPV